MSTREVTMSEWAPPKGFANGRIGAGRVLHVGGQIGTTPDGKLVKGGLLESNFPPQFAQALDNVIAVVKAAGGTVEDIAEMTVYVTRMETYRNARKEIAPIWKERMGKHFPAMALVGVEDLFEPEAVVEIQAVAYIGDQP